MSPPRRSGAPTGPPAPSIPPSGQLGPYRILDRIAVGGMAEVFRAHEPKPAGEPRLVAIKRMLPGLAEDPKSCEMFREERRLGEQIQHSHVVDVLGYGEEGGRPYLVLEYVPGVDLWRLMRSLMRDGTRLPIPLTIYVMRSLLLGLQAVHEARSEHGESLELVHRDISPSNVLLSSRGEVKLSDFGIAVSRAGPGGGTLTERAKGKLGYLAPEQVLGAPVDRRADVFSAAVIAAELLMGRPLFSGGSELAVLLAIRDAQVHPFSTFAEQLPPGLGALVLRGLRRAPEERHPTAQVFGEKLGAHCQEDDASLRQQLAALVQSVLRGELERAQTPRLEALGESDATPLVPTLGMPWDGRSSDPPAGRPISSFEVRSALGEDQGVFTYAALVEAISTGRLGPMDIVREAKRGLPPTERPPFRAIGAIASLGRHLPPSTSTPRHSEGPLLGAPIDTVDLAHGAIIATLGQAALRGDTGLLLCEAGGVRKEIYLQDGTPEFVTSNVAAELLGEYLVANKVISRSELDMALAVMPRFEGRLGETLRALGLVDPVPLFRHIAAQIRQKILDLFLWTNGQATFYEGVPPPPTNFPPGLQAWPLLLDGVRLRLRQGMEKDPSDATAGVTLRRTSLGDLLAVDPQLSPELRMILAALETPQRLASMLGRSDGPNQTRPGVPELLLLARLRAIDGLWLKR